MIAVNKLRPSGGEDDAERGALDALARRRARVAAADRPDRGDARRGSRGALGRRSRSTALPRRGGPLDERRRRNLARRGVRARVGAREGASRATPSRTTPSSAAARRRSQRARARPARPPCARSSSRCSGVGGARRRHRPSLTIEARAASGSRASRASRPVYRVGDVLARSSAATVLLKAENLQRTGSFKIRGAVNRSRSLATPSARPASSRRAPATTARRWRGRRARSGARRRSSCRRTPPMAKVDATRRYGAERRARRARASTRRSPRRTRARRRDRRDVSCTRSTTSASSPGQGTLGLELAEQLPDAETVVVPIGGGGLAAGIAIALGELRRGAIVGVQAAAARRSPAATERATRSPTASRSSSPGELTWPILDELARRGRHRHRRGDRQRDPAAPRADEARRRGRGRGRRRGAARRPRRGRRHRRSPSSPAATSTPTLLIAVMRHGLTRPAATSSCARGSPTAPASSLKLLRSSPSERGERRRRRAPPRGHATSRSARPRSS